MEGTVGRLQLNNSAAVERDWEWGSGLRQHQGITMACVLPVCVRMRGHYGSVSIAIPIGIIEQDKSASG